MVTQLHVLSATGFVVAVATAAVLVAQTADKPAFDVASIKPVAQRTAEEIRGTSIGFHPGGRFVARNASLGGLLIYAYRGDQFTLRREQIAGGPSWLYTTFFDIDAKVAEPSAVPISWDPTGVALLRSLLEERFKLEAHMESKEFSVYVLLRARSDGTLGPTLRPSLVDCQASLEAARNNPSQPLPPPPAGRPRCGVVRVYGSLVAGGSTMTPLIGALSNAVDTAVLDRTGLTGNYDIELHWQQQSRSAAPTAAASGGPSIFTAVREQLGLKLESRREPMDLLVIDHVEKPTPN